MTTRRYTAAVLALGSMGLGTGAQATLIDLGNGLIKDTAQNLIWTQDANLAASNTFGLATETDLGTYAGDSSEVQGFINTNGTMNWPGARFWIDAMNAANYKGYHDWRLWQVTDLGNDGCVNGYIGTECGFNVNTATSELASLWYDMLGNIAFIDTGGNFSQPGWGLSNTGPFINMQSNRYWSGTEYAPGLSDSWLFQTSNGSQSTSYKDGNGYGWAVRDGQVAAAPVPATVWLIALGLAGLGFRKRGGHTTANA